MADYTSSIVDVSRGPSIRTVAEEPLDAEGRERNCSQRAQRFYRITSRSARPIEWVRGPAAPDATIPESSPPQFLPAAGESIKVPDRGRIYVLLRKSAQSASCFRPTVPAEKAAPLPLGLLKSFWTQRT